MMAQAMKRLALAAGVAILLSGSIGAYSLLSYKWPDGTILMQMQLGSQSGTLIDGSTSWSAAVEPAMSSWNSQVSRVEFRVIRDSTAARGDGNGQNNVFFDSTVYGDSFGDNTIAVATAWRRGTARTEADVIFNTNYSWNSYRGAIRRASSGGNLQDIRRVALHEFGHVMGLDHPDDEGQSVSAIMNSTISNVETLQNDDINGVRALYPSGTTTTPPPTSTPTVTVTFPPRNETLDFRQQLETKYRTGLGRAAGPTFVDNEGAAVWLTEYLRYRLSQCNHATAEQRVIAQIDGLGIQPVCGAPTSLTFPIRSDSLLFRTTLEAKYRDGLRRGAGASSVDVEGEAVWMSEYLRYRVNRCGHTDTINRVFNQIDGRGIAATC
jgi:hypothetical protein